MIKDLSLAAWFASSKNLAIYRLGAEHSEPSPSVSNFGCGLALSNPIVLQRLHLALVVDHIGVAVLQSSGHQGSLDFVGMA